MSLLNAFRFAIPILLLAISEVTSKSRSYFFQDQSVTYLEAWMSCKDKGLQLATAESLDDYDELARVLNLPSYKGEFFWSTDGVVHIDRNIPWRYITFNDEEMTLIAEDGQKVTTRCMLVRGMIIRDLPATEWSYDLCTQTHRYFCDQI